MSVTFKRSGVKQFRRDGVTYRIEANWVLEQVGPPGPSVPAHYEVIASRRADDEEGFTVLNPAATRDALRQYVTDSVTGRS